MADVSVLLSTYNRPKALNLVLAGLAQQSVAPDQIIIGDDGSGEDTRAVIEHWQRAGLPIVHCWHPDDGFRKSLIMNQAIARTEGRLAIFLDGDCVPLTHFVRHHRDYFSPGRILAGPRILANRAFTDELENRKVSLSGRPYLTWLRDRLQGRINRIAPLITLPDGRWRDRHPRRWQWVRGCNFSVATDALRRVGGFEESFIGWGLEDSELAVRLINSGERVKSLRFAAPVIHLWHEEGSRANVAANERYLRAALTDGRTKAMKGLSPG